MKTMHPKATTYTRLALALTFSLLLATAAFATPNEKDPVVLEDPGTVALSEVQWDAFSKNLVHAFTTHNEGVKLAALQLVIKYSDYVDVHGARFDMMRLYRDNKDDNVRRMAVVALGKIQNPWALHFFERAVHFEQSDMVRHTMQAVLANYHQN